MGNKLDRAVEKYVKEDSIPFMRGFLNGFIVLIIFWGVAFTALWKIVSPGGTGDEGSMSLSATVIEKREMIGLERGWWQETIACLVENDKISDDELSLIVEPEIVVIEGNLFECPGHTTSPCTKNFDVFISQKLIGIGARASVFRHEFTHVLELAVKDRVSDNHTTGWWRDGGESICQSNEDVAELRQPLREDKPSGIASRNLH